MDSRILIAYASISGSTGEVAEAIADVIREENAAVQVSHVRDVDDVQGFSAVVLGSSIRAGRWLPEAVRFLEDHQTVMSQVPVAYFTTCLAMVNDTEESRKIVLAYMESVLGTAPEITPIGLGLFAGSLDPDRQLFMQVTGPQGDYRDWEAIKAWAQEIRPALLSGRASKPAVTLVGTDLAGADLSQSDLRGVNLRHADLVKTDLSEANLHNANLNWAEMNWANMSGTNLVKANLIGADLHQASLDNANLNHATLNGANLSDADLSGADLRYADLNWADLRRANLHNANLSYANLGWANFSNANLEGANLNNARYNSYTEWPQGFSAQASGGILVGGELH